MIDGTLRPTLTRDTSIPHNCVLEFARQYPLREGTMRTLSICSILALVVSAPAMAASLSRTVESGMKKGVAEHVAFSKSCVAQHVVVKITTPPANGSVTTTEESKVLPAKTELGGVQSCAGKSAPTAVVYYQSKLSFKGTDQFKYQRTNEDNPNDRLNGEIIITVTVK